MNDDISQKRNRYVRFHTSFGWWGLLLFATLGLVLEAMLGFKVDFYLNVDHEVRRLVWRLAHAHGALLSLIHIAFAATLACVSNLRFGKRTNLASLCLISATILLPGGFFAGGFGIHESDPGAGIYLVPLGGVILMFSILLIALETSSKK